MKNTTVSAVTKVAVVAAYTVLLVSTVAYRRSRMPAAQAVEQTKPQLSSLQKQRP